MRGREREKNTVAKIINGRPVNWEMYEKRFKLDKGDGEEVRQSKLFIKYKY